MAGQPNELVEHFFRHESANLIAVLTRTFGLRRLELVEDMVQRAMLEALQTWKHHGLPREPAAWIHRAAKNRIVDAIRRQRVDDVARRAKESTNDWEPSFVEEWFDEEQLPDSLLRMMFVCCHPCLDPRSQLAFALRTLCSFDHREIARGLMLTPEAVKKRLQRARRTLIQRKVEPELPADDEIASRRESVHTVLYLMFNEGYRTSRGEQPIRADICEEASRLCYLLCESPYGTPASDALLALLLFQAARFDARMSNDGVVILLADQDRTQWDAELIAAGHRYLRRSRTTTPSFYHYEAAIAEQHCLAQRTEDTDWHTIVQLYDRLRIVRPSPLYDLNRAIAVGECGDHREALACLERLHESEDLSHYLLLDCALARQYERCGDPLTAARAYQSALGKSPAEHERAFVQARLDALAGAKPS